ncbi:hypothetical protein [Sinorhizobium sp. BJ1]|nr:hypothetical protein [Sinorhizobium sp. BJ1]
MPIPSFRQVILSSREAGRALLLGHRPLDASFADNIVAIALEVVSSA